VGELRLGRDYAPSFYNLNATMHPFGTNGVGSSGHLFYPVNTGGTTVRTNVRVSNSVGYHLPDNDLGVYGTLMHGRGEQPPGAATSHDGNFTGARVGWRGAGVNLAVARSKTIYATGNYAQTNAAINYQLGPAKLMYLWGRNDVGATRTTAQMIGTQYQVTEAGELRLHFTRLKAERVANDATHWAVGWVHDLSKRTQLYATYGVIDNKDNGTRFDNGVRPTTPGGASRGADVGIKHSF
jgi:predicted porin